MAVVDALEEVWLRAKRVASAAREAILIAIFGVPARLCQYFLCYRRDDSPYAVDRIYRVLADRFGAAYVFRDLDDAPLGEDYTDVTEDRIAGCRAVFVAMGPEFLGPPTGPGERRIDSEDDPVRVEIERALDSGVLIIPLLVGGRSDMVPDEELPPSIRSLTKMTGLKVRPDPDFPADMDRLFERLSV